MTTINKILANEERWAGYEKAILLIAEAVAEADALVHDLPAPGGGEYMEHPAPGWDMIASINHAGRLMDEVLYVLREVAQ